MLSGGNAGGSEVRSESLSRPAVGPILSERIGWFGCEIFDNLVGRKVLNFVRILSNKPGRDQTQTVQTRV